MIHTFHIFQILSVYSAKNKKSVRLSIIHVGAVAGQKIKKKKEKKKVKEKHGTWIWRLMLGIAYYVIAMDVWDLKLQK